MFAYGTYKTKEDSLAKIFNFPPSEVFRVINKRMIEVDTSNVRIIQQIFSVYVKFFVLK